jgi:hypothetical protein
MDGAAVSGPGRENRKPSCSRGEGGEPVTVDGQVAGYLVRLGEDRGGDGGQIRDGHVIYAHAGCGGRVQHGRSGAWCTRCLDAVPPESELRLGLVLTDGFSP